MQYVNNDMDEVFRKAAEHYPLDTRSSDWNKVLAALEEKEPEPVPAKKENHYKRLLWLLLLLPLYLICNRPVSQSDPVAERSGDTPVVQQHTKMETSDKERLSTGKENNIPVQEGHSTQGGTTKENQLKAGSDASGEVRNQTVSANKKPRVIETTSGVHVPIQITAVSNKKTGVDKKHKGVKPGIAKNNLPLDNSFEDEKIKELSDIHESTQGEFIPEPFRSSFTSHIDIAPKENHIAAIDFRRQDIAGAIIRKESALKKQKLYLGLMGGIDRTTIKNQRADDMGYDYGALIGYELGKKWSVEAAVFMDKKSYYTNGKYLTTSKVYRPANSEITDVTGTCRMYDISLGVKYNLRQTSRSSFFTTTGISSYLMKKEDYSYTYYYPMTGAFYIYDASYKNDSRNFLSVANISFGYTHQIGKIAQVRIEPYLKIPVRNVGYAELPLFSTGIRAGFVRKLF